MRHQMRHDAHYFAKLTEIDDKPKQTRWFVGNCEWNYSQIKDNQIKDNQIEDNQIEDNQINCNKYY